MTTVDQTLPGRMAGVLMALAEKRARAKQTQATAGARSIVLLIARATLQLAGFTMLTIAGYHISFVAGSITAAISCFLVSWLLTGMSATPDPNPNQAHPSTVHGGRR